MYINVDSRAILSVNKGISKRLVYLSCKPDINRLVNSDLEFEFSILYINVVTNKFDFGNSLYSTKAIKFNL